MQVPKKQRGKPRGAARPEPAKREQQQQRQLCQPPSQLPSQPPRPRPAPIPVPTPSTQTQSQTQSQIQTPPRETSARATGKRKATHGADDIDDDADDADTCAYPDTDADDHAEPPCGRPRKRVPAQVWDEIRPVFARLYQEEKRPLKEVMSIMEKEHRFVATVKMYKSRIWKWGLDKKLKGDEVLAILILLGQRERQSRPRTGFMIRKQPVDMENVKRYLKRNPSLMAKYRSGQVPSVQTSHEVECFTPLPSPRLAPCGSEPYQAEKMLALVRDYVGMAFASGTWVCEYDVSCTTSAGPADRTEDLFERVIASFALVNRFLMRGDRISINAMLDPAFESLKEIVAAESPIFLARTVCLLWYLDRHHQHDMLRIVLDYLTHLIPIVLHANPVITQIWAILGTTDFSDYFELALRLYDVLVPLLQDRIGPANYLMYILYTDHTDGLFHRNRASDALSVATRYRRRAESSGRRHPWLVDLAISQTAAECRVHEEGGRYHHALGLISSLLEYDLNVDQQAGVNLQMGAYHYRLGGVRTAVRCYREATRLAVTADVDERLLLTCLANLERALKRMGRLGEADRVLQYRFQRLDDFARESRSIMAAPPQSRPPSTAAAAAVSMSAAGTLQSSSWPPPPPPLPLPSHQHQHQQHPIFSSNIETTSTSPYGPVAGAASSSSSSSSSSSGPPSTAMSPDLDLDHDYLSWLWRSENDSVLIPAEAAAAAAGRQHGKDIPWIMPEWTDRGFESEYGPLTVGLAARGQEEHAHAFAPERLEYGVSPLHHADEWPLDSIGGVAQFL